MGSNETTSSAAVAADFTLGSEAVPFLYELFLQPNTHKGELRGRVRVHLKISSPLKKEGKMLQLHALGIAVDEMRVSRYKATHCDNDEEEVKHLLPPVDAPAASNFTDEVAPQGSQPIEVVETTYDERTEIMSFILSEAPDVSDRLMLDIQYTARLELMKSKKPSGLHYYDFENDHHAVVTHLEPTNARCLYPCFDEPRFKSRYQVTVQFLKGYTVVSNTLMENRQVDLADGESDVLATEAARKPDGSLAPEGMQLIRYGVTPPIPAYLVSVATGRLQCLATETKRGVITRVFFSTGQDSSNGWYVLDLLTKAVEYYEEYFAFDLPLKKLDIVGLNNFTVLGMENWGMLCFHGEYMLVTEATPIERRQRIARLVAHEVAHQWFGNVVSLKSWKYIWLKEAFCRFLEFFFVNQLFPRWSMWGEFLETVFNGALLMDSPPQYHPIEVDVFEPRKVFDYFDQISYGKGAAVLRMMATLVGESVMTTAMRKLINDNAYKCIDTEDFVQAVGSCVPRMALQGVNLTGVVMQWVSTKGHPLIYVEKAVDGCGFTVSQYLLPSYQEGALNVLRSSHHRTMSGSTPSSQTSFSMMTSTPPKLALGGSNNSGDSKDGNALFWSAGAQRQLFYHPSRIMEASNFVIPLKMMEIEQGKTSQTSLMVLREPQESIKDKQMVYFNPGAAAVVRVDYDVPIWDEIFAIAPYLQSIDKLAITITLFEMRPFHIGSATEKLASLNIDPLETGATPPSEKQTGSVPVPVGERCTLLLKWIYELCIQQCEKNAHVWKCLNNQLWTLANMLAASSCWNSFRKFISAAYNHLVVGKQIGFRATENRTEFKASHNLSDQMVTDSLQLLCLCSTPQVMEEATSYAEWALSPWKKASTPVGGSGGGLVLDDTEPTNNDSPIDLTSKVQCTRARIAIENVIVHNYNDRGNAMWARCVCIVLFLLKAPAIEEELFSQIFSDSVEPEEEDAPGPLGGVGNSLASVDIDINQKMELFEVANSDARQTWLEMLLPAVLSHRRPATFSVQLGLIDMLAFMPLSTYQSLARNGGLVKQFLKMQDGNGSVPKSKNHFRIIRGLLYYTATSGPADTTVLALFKPFFPLETMDSATQFLETLDINCTWVDYVSQFYSSFLSIKVPELLSDPIAQSMHDGPVSI